MGVVEESFKRAWEDLKNQLGFLLIGGEILPSVTAILIIIAGIILGFVLLLPFRYFPPVVLVAAALVSAVILFFALFFKVASVYSAAYLVIKNKSQGYASPMKHALSKLKRFTKYALLLALIYLIFIAVSAILILVFYGLLLLQPSLLSVLLITILALFGVIAAIYLSFRLSLVFPLIFYTDKDPIRESLRLTKENPLDVFLTWILVQVTKLIGGIIGSAIPLLGVIISMTVEIYTVLVMFHLIVIMTVRKASKG